MSESSRQALFELLTPSHRWRVDGPSVVRLLGLCWIGAAAWFVGTDFSLVVGAGLIALGIIARPVTTVAVGHAALIPFAAEPMSTASLVPFGLFGGGLLLLLLGERPSTPVVALLTVTGAAALVAIAGVVVATAGLAAAGAFVVATLAAVSALLFRYEQLSVDPLDARRAADSESQELTQ